MVLSVGEQASRHTENKKVGLFSVLLVRDGMPTYNLADRKY